MPPTTDSARHPRTYGHRVNPLTFIRALPQPLKTFYVLFFLSFAGTFVTTLSHRGGARGSIPLGISAVLIGLTLVSDLRGGATAVAAQMRDRKPLGIDYSRSVLASTGSVRFFGVVFALVGGAMTYAGVTHP